MGSLYLTGSKKRSSKIKNSFHKTFTKLSYRLHIRGVIYSQRDESRVKGDWTDEDEVFVGLFAKREIEG